MSGFDDDALAGLSVGGEIIADSDGTDPDTGIRLEDDLDGGDVPALQQDRGGADDDLDDGPGGGGGGRSLRVQGEALEGFAQIEGAGGAGGGFIDPHNDGGEGGEEGGEEVYDEDQGSLADEVLADALPPGRKSAELSLSEINQMKSDYLFKIRSLEEAGYQASRNYSAEDSLVSLQLELRRLQEMEDLTYSLKLARGVLTHSCSLLETVNETTKVSPLKLRGFSAAVRRDVDSRAYDSALQELSQKYFYRLRMGPEMKIFIGLSTSAINCHLTNSLLESSQTTPNAQQGNGAGTGPGQGQGNNNNVSLGGAASGGGPPLTTRPVSSGGVGSGSGGGGALQGNLFNLASTMMGGGRSRVSGAGKGGDAAAAPPAADVHQPSMAGPQFE